MAVQKSKKSRSRSGMRRAHDRVFTPTLSVEAQTGETHIRHHMTETGYYRGKQILPSAPLSETEEGAGAESSLPLPATPKPTEA